MTDNQLLLRDIDGFLTTHDIPIFAHTSGLNLDESGGDTILAEMDTLLHSLQKSSAKERKTNRDIAREKAGQRRDAYRLRRKEEWATLRQQDVDLTEQLARLKQRKIRVSSQTGPNDSLTIGAWRAIAMRQFESRKEAEELQKRLRTAVTSRTAILQDFQRVLSKRLREAERLEAPDVLDRCEATDAMLYETYYATLNTLYERLDEIFAEVGTNTTPGMILAGEPTKKMNGESEYFENIGVGRVPFDFQRTCDAVWELTCAPHRQDGRQVYDGLPDSENTKAVQYSSFLRCENGEVFSLKTYQVARRYIEKSRHVLVWRALSEGGKDFPALNLDETGWCVIHGPSSDAELLAGSASTLVQACIRLTPLCFREIGAELKGKLELFVELSVKTLAEDNQEIENMMERLLLDDVFATNSLEIDEEGNLTSITF